MSPRHIAISAELMSTQMDQPVISGISLFRMESDLFGSNLDHVLRKMYYEQLNT